MILPIVAYGDPVLKKKASDISPDYPDLKNLIADMFETMYNAAGVGLAAPQIGKSIRLFIVDASSFAEDEDATEEEKKLIDYKKVFINPVITKEEGEPWGFNEGCLSIPGIREEVFRKEKITIEYLDENFTSHKDTVDGIAARIIQHEYDHIEGTLFVERISLLRRQMIKRKLDEISKGLIETKYKMRFPKTKR